MTSPKTIIVDSLIPISARFDAPPEWDNMSKGDRLAWLSKAIENAGDGVWTDSLFHALSEDPGIDQVHVETKGAFDGIDDGQLFVSPAYRAWAEAYYKSPLEK